MEVFKTFYWTTMLLNLDSDSLYCEVTGNKNALYITNPTIRNPIRLLDFYYFISLLVKKFGNNTPIKYDDFFLFVEDYGSTLLTHKNKTLASKIRSFSRRFCELKILGLIDFKVSNGAFIFQELDISSEIFNPLGYTLDTPGFDFLEVNSNFLLFILSSRNTLQFITSLIQSVESKWNTIYKGQRKGVSNLELEFIYVLIPFLDSIGKNNVTYISDLILEYRNKYKAANSKQTYNSFLDTQLELFVLSHREFKFIKLSSAKEYIDVLLRTLESSHCFKLINQFKMYSLVINTTFISKLNYFLLTSFDKLKNEFITNVLVKNLKSYEKKYYYSTINKEISHPTSYRYNNQIAERKNNYFTFDQEIHNAALNNYLKKDSLYWYEFEDLSNLTLTHYVKFHLNQVLNSTNLTYAIKLDEYGAIKNSTTSSVEDLSIVLDNMILVVESSLQNGLSARKNEGAPVLDHCNKLYFNDSKKRKLLCFIVFPNKPSNGFYSDFISHNRLNLALNRDIIYYPIAYEEFKNIMLTNPVSLLDFFNNVKKKLSFIPSELQLKAQNSLLTFNDFGLII